MLRLHLWRAENTDTDDFIAHQTHLVISPTQNFLLTSWRRFNVHFIQNLVMIIQWIGVWNLIEYNFLPQYPFSRAIFLLVFGLFGLFLQDFFFPPGWDDVSLVQDWGTGKPQQFPIGRFISRWGVKYIHFMMYCVFWAGAWDVFDIFIGRINFTRDLLYAGITFICLFIFEELLCYESLVWILLSFSYVVLVGDLTSASRGSANSLQEESTPQLVDEDEPKDVVLDIET